MPILVSFRSKSMPLRAAAAVVILLAAGAAGGFVFRLLDLPLPWTLGAMTAAGLISLLKPQWTLPPVMRDGARPVIGVMAGSAFTPQLVGDMLGWWPMILLLATYFLLTGLAGQVFFRKFCGFDQTTALLASMPGGLGEMAILGSQLGADTRRLVLVHSIRIILVVSAVPFIVRAIQGIGATARMPAIATSPAHGVGDWLVLIACGVVGYLVGRKLRGFGGVMLVPLVFSAILHGTGVTTAAPPGWLVAGVQVVIGCLTGGRFAGVKAREAGAAVLQGAVWTLLLLTSAVLLAMLAAPWIGKPGVALFLALTPGGFAEMTTLAFVIGIEVAFVVTCHMFRTFYVLSSAPIINRLMARGKSPGQTGLE